MLIVLVFFFRCKGAVTAIHLPPWLLINGGRAMISRSRDDIRSKFYLHLCWLRKIVTSWKELVDNTFSKWPWQSLASHNQAMKHFHQSIGWMRLKILLYTHNKAIFLIIIFEFFKLPLKETKNKHKIYRWGLKTYNLVCNCKKQVRIKSVTQGCKHAASVNRELNKHSICNRCRLQLRKFHIT